MAARPVALVAKAFLAPLRAGTLRAAASSSSTPIASPSLRFFSESRAPVSFPTYAGPSRPSRPLRSHGLQLREKSILRQVLFTPKRFNSTKPREGGDVAQKAASEASSTGPSSGSASAAAAPGLTARRGPPCPNCAQQEVPSIPPTPPPAPPSVPPKLLPPANIHDYTPFIRRLIQRSQELGETLTHRPSRDDLLKAANSWWERFRIRLRWFTIRGWRRFNTDDLSAFFSWFVVGNALWILVGTTTFVAAVVATLNSLSMQEYVARWISDYLTSAAGVTVIFESAIVPKWGSSTISFRNVYVSRRPQNTSDKEEAAPQQKTSTATPPLLTPLLSSGVPPDTYLHPQRAAEADNYTMFDINFEEVEVTLSMQRWLDGKGLVKDAKVKGVRGVIDRRSVWWDTTKKLEPADFRHPTYPGDFELDSFQVEDFLVTVYQPGGQRPYNVSIFNAKYGPFRKRWLFYDMLAAESMTGQYDNCLFSLHMPQKLGKSHGELAKDVRRMARFRIDGLPIEHAQYAAGYEGVVSWFTSGKLDAVLDIKFPQHPDDDDVDIKAIFEDIGRNVAAISVGVHPDDAAGDHFDVASQLHDTLAAVSDFLPGQHRLARPPLRAPEQTMPATDKRQVTIDIDLRFRDLKAAVPVFTSDITLTNNALIRPIVAFINANRTLVPIHCQVAADISDFDGSWTLFETGLMSSISSQIYSALAHHVSSEAANSKRLRQVSVWGIQRGTDLLLGTLRNMVVDPVYGQNLNTV